jgi:hypothetical protein
VGIAFCYTVDPRVTLTYEQKTWVTTKILVLTYDQILSYDPHAGQGHLSYDPHGVVSFSLSPDTRVCGRISGQCFALYN